MEEPEELGRCRHGHFWTEENTLWESSGGHRGRKRRRCRQCRRDKRAARAAEVDRAESPSQIQPRVQRSRVGPEQSLNVGRAITEFNTALKHVTPHCDGKYNSFTDWDESNIPSPATAEEMCKPCPVRLLCKANAHAQNQLDPMQPGWGVLGGEVWIYGEIYEGGTG